MSDHDHDAVRHDEHAGQGSPELRQDLRVLLAMLDEVLDLAAVAPVLAEPGAAPEGGEGAGPTVAGQTAATVDDYRYARDLVELLEDTFDELGAEALDRLELNADLRQLAFHLDEELEAQRTNGLDPVVLARSLTFLKRHIVRLRAEYTERRHLLLDPDERALLTGLAKLTRHRYTTTFAPRYDEIGYRRPYVDKFYRDYSLSGIPEGLLLALAELASGTPEYDVFVCVLKGGLSFSAILELLGVPSERIVHVMAGRASGSHYEDTYMFRPVDFAPGDLRGKAVLLVENNLATGSTLTHLAASVADLAPSRLGIFLDYILTDLAGIDAANLSERVRHDFDAIHCGPWPARVDDPDAERRATGARRQLLAALAARRV